MNLVSPSEPLMHYDYKQFAHAKDFVFRMWCALASERHQQAPEDLSGACKYGSLFMRQVFGGSIEGHYAHQFNRIDLRIVDLSHDALDVRRMKTPYQHEAGYFDIPEYRIALQACAPRVDSWVQDFMREAG
ncbi:MAG TPA: hypothetical protein VLC92_00915 [Rhodocyclaceae bacterium]|nr:hypothetical protein [Rhodocyclaceae bacterium]